MPGRSRTHTGKSRSPKNWISRQVFNLTGKAGGDGPGGFWRRRGGTFRTEKEDTERRRVLLGSGWIGLLLIVELGLLIIASKILGPLSLSISGTIAAAMLTQLAANAQRYESNSIFMYVVGATLIAVFWTFGHEHLVAAWSGLVIGWSAELKFWALVAESLIFLAIGVCILVLYAEVVDPERSLRHRQRDDIMEIIHPWARSDPARPKPEIQVVEVPSATLKVQVRINKDMQLDEILGLMCEEWWLLCTHVYEDALLPVSERRATWGQSSAAKAPYRITQAEWKNITAQLREQGYVEWRNPAYHEEGTAWTTEFAEAVRAWKECTPPPPRSLTVLGIHK